MRDTDVLLGLCAPLWDDADPRSDFTEARPMLAHYTTLATLEAIIRSNQLWLSHPLQMNDHEELRYGMNLGFSEYQSNKHSVLAALGDDQARYILFQHAYEGAYSRFANAHTMDTYVACFCEHKPGDKDGLLSMWRAYGGQGSGVAMVLDIAALEAIEESPLIFTKVRYLPTEERQVLVHRKFAQFVEVIAGIADDEMSFVVDNYLMWLRNFALTTKHIGFLEEQEWRVIYYPERDPNETFKRMFGYVIGPSGVMPKLKLDIEHIEGATHKNFSLDLILSKIIVGPAASSPFAVASVRRLLELVGRPEFARLVRGSSTPLRPALGSDF